MANREYKVFDRMEFVTDELILLQSEIQEAKEQNNAMMFHCLTLQMNFLQGYRIALSDTLEHLQRGDKE